MKHEDKVKKTAQELGLRAEKAVVILYDHWTQRFLVQLKDAGYHVEQFQHTHALFGAGLKPEPKETALGVLITRLKREQKQDIKETPLRALEARLTKEFKAANKRVISGMRYWKKFRLQYGSGIDGEYTCYVYVMLTDKKGLDDLQYDTLADGGIRQGSLTLINRRDLEAINSRYVFMASQKTVLLEFLKEVDMGSGEFQKKLAAAVS